MPATPLCSAELEWLMGIVRIKIAAEEKQTNEEDNARLACMLSTSLPFLHLTIRFIIRP